MACKLTDCSCALKGKTKLERLKCINYIVPISKTDTGDNIIGQRKRKTIKKIIKPTEAEMEHQKRKFKK